MSTITVFLFGRSHADLWKTDIGFVVGILNPKGEKIILMTIIIYNLSYNLIQIMVYYKIGK